jgi:hypothetical protein
MMRTTVKKLFWIWQFEEEEKWLNEMAAKGLALISVGFCRYDFEECTPGEYKIGLQLLEHAPSHPESAKYIGFVEETGAEHVGSFKNWVYFRKRASEGAFELISDKESRVKQLSSIIRLLWILFAVNTFVAVYNLSLVFIWDSPANAVGMFNAALSVLLLLGALKIGKKRKKLREEQKIFE